MDFDFQPDLKGELIAMRPFTEADRDALFQVAADPLIWKVHPAHDRWQRAVFDAYIDDALSDRGGLVAIERDIGAIVGFSRYSQRFTGPEEIEIGWTFLTRRLWGGTYNRDMKRQMLAHALAVFPRAIFRVGEDNVRSRRAMEKIGGVLTPWDEAPVIVAVRPARHVAYAITRDSFANGPLV